MTKLSSLLLLLLAASAGIAPCTAIKKRYSREVRGGKRKLMSTYGWDGTGGIVDVSPTEEPTHGADFFWSGGGEEVAPPPVRVPTTPRPSSRRYVTMDPTRRPTPAPSNRPTPKPTKQPTNHPTPNPTNQPTNRPTPKPVNQLYIPPGTSWGGSTVEIIQTAKPTRRPTSNPTVSSAWGGGYTGIDNNDVPSINQDFIDYDVNSSSGSNGITHEESVPMSTVDENGNLQVVVEVGGGGEYITIDVGGDGGSETYIVDYPGVGQSVEEGVATIATVATAGTSVTDSSTGLFDDGFFGSQEYVDQDVTDIIGFTTTGATSSVSGVGTTESTSFVGGIFGEDTANFVGDVVDSIFGENNTMTSTKSTDMVMNTGLDKPLDILERICEAWKNDEVYSSENPVDIEFAYEIAVNQDFSVDNIVQSLDEVLGQRVGKEVLNCDGLDLELSDDANFDVELDDFVSMSMPQVSGGSDTTDDDLRDGRLLVESGDVQGIGNSPDFVTGQECSYFTLETGNLPPNSECHVVNGLITLYLNSTDRGTVAEEVHALLEVSMNKESSGYLDLIQGLEGVHYNGVPSVDPVIIRSIGSDESSEPISPIWIGGIAMISVGSIAVIAAIVFFIRKKNSDTESPERFSKLQDDASFDSTKDETAETKDFFVDIMINSDEDSFGNTLGNEAVLGEFGVSPSTARPGDIPNYMKDTQGF